MATEPPSTIKDEAEEVAEQVSAALEEERARREREEEEEADRAREAAAAAAAAAKSRLVILISCRIADVKQAADQSQALRLLDDLRFPHLELDGMDDEISPVAMRVRDALLDVSGVRGETTPSRSSWTGTRRRWATRHTRGDSRGWRGRTPTICGGCSAGRPEGRGTRTPRSPGLCLRSDLHDRIVNETDLFTALDVGNRFARMTWSCAQVAFVGAVPRHRIGAQ